MSKNITKVIRLEIVKPLNGDWKEVGKYLREVQKLTAHALNFCMREYFIEHTASIEQEKQIEKKKETKANQEVKPHKKPKISQTAKLGNLYGERVCSYVYDQIASIAMNRWKTDKKKIVRNEVSLPTYRSNCPIYIRATGVSIKEVSGEKYPDRILELKLRPRVEGGRSGPVDSFVLHNKSFDDSRKAIWDRLLKKEYKLGMVQLIYSERQNKWFANISYTFETEPNVGLDQNTIVGVDLGVSVPVCLAVNNSYARAFLYEEGESITSFRKQVENRRRKLRRNERGILERQSGRGRKHKLASIEKLRELENNFRRTANHRLSRAIINFALKHRAGKIVMEDLSGFREEKIQERTENEEQNNKSKRFLEEWSTFELKTMVQNKANEAGIIVEFVNPAYTSQRCSKCGYIAKENRPEQSKFHCKKCDFKVNADYNAAKNLATPNIVSILKNSLIETAADTVMEA